MPACLGSAAKAPEAAKAWTGRVRIKDRCRDAIRHRGSRVPLTRQDLAKRLNEHCNPSELSFAGRGLGDERVEARWASKRLVLAQQGAFLSEVICEALKRNSTVTSIKLRVCHIGDEGAEACWASGGSDLPGFLSREAIGKVLKTNSTLTSIDLRHNRIGEEGAEARWCQGLAQAEGSGGSKCPPALATHCRAVSLRGTCRGSEQQHNSSHNLAPRKRHPRRERAGLGGSQGSCRGFRSFVLQRPSRKLPGEGSAGSRREREGLLRVRWHGDCRHAPPAPLRLTCDYLDYWKWWSRSQ